MASRLSEEVLREGLAGVVDAGHQALPVETPWKASALLPTPVDVDALLLSEDPVEAVQAVAPQALYHAILAKGPEECLELLPLMSEDQVIRIMDYDVWRQDQLEIRRAARWLSLFKEVSDEEMYRRFRDLDEEYQLGLLGPYIDLIDEELYEKLGSAEQDALHRLPCGTLHYRVKSEDPAVVEFINQLIEATLSSDVSYAYALLTHAAYNPPNEAEAQLAQFRAARLSEDGFVTYDESLAAFRPVGLEALRKKYEVKADDLLSTQDQLPVAVSSESKLFLLDVMASMVAENADQAPILQHQLLHLANSLCSALQVEADDTGGLRRILTHAQGLVSLGLEYLSSGDVKVGATILATEHPQVLFRTGLTLVNGLANAALKQLERHKLPGTDDMVKKLQLNKRGLLLDAIDQNLLALIGYEQAELLKGACNRLPVVPQRLQVQGSRGPRVVFAPIGSMAQLMALASKLDALSGMLAVAQLADDDSSAATVSVDKRLMTAFARALAGGQFTGAPLTNAELESLSSRDVASLQDLAVDVMRSIEGTLRLAVGTPNGDSWAVSENAGVSVSDPAQRVQGVMAGLADLLMQLSTALRHARDTETSTPHLDRVLSNLLLVQEIKGGTL